MHEKTLIVGIFARHSAGDTVVLRLAPLKVAFRRPLKHKSHVSVPYSTPMAIPNLKIHGISVQRVARDKILYDAQRRLVNPPGQLLVVGTLRKHFDGGNPSGWGKTVDGDSVRLRSVDGAVACRRIKVRCRVGQHGILGSVARAVETGREDGLVGTLVVAVVADRVYKDVRGDAGAAPEVGEVA